MNRIAIDDVEHPPTISPADVLRPLSDPLGATDVAVNHFELAPGDTFGFDYHRHLDQEELFVVFEGVATFRTESGDVRKSSALSSQPETHRVSGDVEVTAGEAVRFAPGELQLGRNEVSERVVALAIGAPRRSTEIEYLRPCPTCDEETIQTPAVREDEATLEIRCLACGTVVEELRREG